MVIDSVCWSLFLWWSDYGCDYLLESDCENHRKSPSYLQRNHDAFFTILSWNMRNRLDHDHRGNLGECQIWYLVGPAFSEGGGCYHQRYEVLLGQTGQPQAFCVTKPIPWLIAVWGWQLAEFRFCIPQNISKPPWNCWVLSTLNGEAKCIERCVENVCHFDEIPHVDAPWQLPVGLYVVHFYCEDVSPPPGKSYWLGIFPKKTGWHSQLIPIIHLCSRLSLIFVSFSRYFHVIKSLLHLRSHGFVASTVLAH